MPTIIERYSHLKCAGGRRLGELASANDGDGNLLPGSTISLGQDYRDAATIVTDAARATMCTPFEVARITESSGAVSEWLMRQSIASPLAADATIVCDPAWMLLGQCSTVRRSGVTGYSTRIAITDTPRNILTAVLMPRAALDGYAWLTLGTIEPTEPITIDLDTVNPLAFIIGVVAAIPNGAVRSIVRNGDVGYVLNIYRTWPVPNTVRASVGDDVTALVIARDTKDSATTIEAFGVDAGAGRWTLAECAWRVSAKTVTTVQLADPGSGLSPDRKSVV